MNDYAEDILAVCARLRGLAWPPSGAGGWDGSLGWLSWHGLAPMAGARLGGAGAFSERAAKSLKLLRTTCVLTHRAAMDVVADVARRFDASGIPYAVLKGPHLFAACYDEAFPRPYGDIDLLVGPHDVSRALGVLAEAGYRPAGGAWSQAFARRVHFHLVLRPEKPGRPEIELHWSLVDRANLYRIDDAAVLGRAEEFRGGAVPFRVLAREDTLLYLCLHVAKHGLLNGAGLRGGRDAAWLCEQRTGNRLIWFCDIDLFLRKEMERIRWPAAADRCSSWNIAADVAATLAAVRMVLPDSPAGDAMELLGLAPPAPGTTLMDRALEGLASHRWFAKAMNMHEEVFFRPARLLQLGHLLFPPPRDLRAFHPRWPGWLLPVLYAVHPIAMIARLVR